MKILLVEDDDVLITLLTKHLTEHHYIVDVVKNREMGWNYGSTFEYDLMILDIDGIDLCHHFRTEGYTTPILLLTAQNTSTAKVNGLDAGADDCMGKPFDVPELIARIRALLRRSNGSCFPLLVWGDLLLNPSTCEVSYNNQSLTLTNKEYELLELLLHDSQHLLSADEILDRLWSSDQFPSEATVRSHVRRLRHKLVAAGAPSDFIATVHGRGYYLKAPDNAPEIGMPNQIKHSIPNSFNLPQSNSQIATKVMVVDNDIDFLRSLPNLLKPWHFKITTLADSQEFWSVLQAVSPDVLMLEANMSQVNGLELCQALRSNPDWQRLPVLFLSVITDANTQNLAFSAGADDFLYKPIAPIDLANRIHNRLQRIRAYN
ncbi:MAG: response regulator [Pseudanabaena sp. CAN_BIN31]|nr:response regulator [Pseudanabaena sp. CAN_BIN31]